MSRKRRPVHAAVTGGTVERGSVAAVGEAATPEQERTVPHDPRTPETAARETEAILRQLAAYGVDLRRLRVQVTAAVQFDALLDTLVATGVLDVAAYNAEVTRRVLPQLRGILQQVEVQRLQAAEQAARERQEQARALAVAHRPGLVDASGRPIGG